MIPLYHPFYCEENAWWAVKTALLTGQPCAVMFVSNPGRRCPLWAQRAAGSDDYVIWDYHVVALLQSEAGWSVIDPDHTLAGVSPALIWLAQTFPIYDGLPVELRPQFRWVEGARFVEVFSTDRSHMLDDAGRYVQPPPPWSPPGTGAMNLQRFVDMVAEFEGEVFDLASLCQRLVPDAPTL